MKTLLRVDASSRVSGSRSRALGDYFEDAKKPYLTLLLNFLGIQDIRFFGIMATTQDEAAVAGNLSKAKHEIISAVSSS